MKLKQWKERHFGQGYEPVAAVDIPGFARAGHALYGNCDDMRVCGYRYNTDIRAWIVYLDMNVSDKQILNSVYGVMGDFSEVLKRLRRDSRIIADFMGGGNVNGTCSNSSQ